MASEQIRRWLRRALTLVRSGKAEAELAREINAHLQLLEDQFVDKGMTRVDARSAARRAFGGVEQAKELHRDERSFRWLAGWSMDLKLGARMLVKSPGLTVIGVIALAVAIGAGAAYLEFTRDWLNPTLPVPAGDRIVGIQVWEKGQREPRTQALEQFPVWRAADTLEHVGAARTIGGHVVTDDSRILPVRGVEISASVFRLVPTPPVQGRTLVDADEQPNAPPVAVIGHDLWQAGFRADPNVAGRTIRAGSTVHTIVGVMPDEFGFPGNENLWVPLKVQAGGLKRAAGPSLEVFGRLKEGASFEAAQSQLQGMLGVDANHPLRADVRPYVDSLLSSDTDNATIVPVLYAANLVFVMLLGICGANVATLVFARTAMREAEITVRTALGASRGRIGAQLFMEALVLSVLAALAGLAVARFAGQWVKQRIVDSMGEPAPFWWHDRLSAATVLYAFGLAVLAALIVGVIPALKATGAKLQGRLREAGAGGSTVGFGRVWTGVVVTQVAFTMIFLATVVSLGWTAYRKHSGLDVTYPRDRFLTGRLVVDDVNAERPRRADAATLQVVSERLRTEPGVADVTYATALPGTIFERFFVEFATPAVAAGATFEGDVLRTQGARVGDNFFETVGIPLVAGRLFSDGEARRGLNVAIVDETFVRLILGGRNPLGVVLREPPRREGDPPGPWREIVGVVKDVTVMTRKRSDAAMLYVPASEAHQVTLLVRTQGTGATLAHRLQAAALAANPNARLVDVTPLDQVTDDDSFLMAFLLRVFAIVSAVALLLSTGGIYALVSFTLARRTREIGIRLALGAAPRRIMTGVFSRAFRQVGIGLLVGALPSFVLLGVGAEDSGGMQAATGAGITLAVAAFVALVALISCTVPLRRALRIEPTQALRADG